MISDPTALVEAQFEYWWNSHLPPRSEPSREIARAAWLTASSLALERQEAERDAFLETLASFHVDPEHGQYDCIGYSEGQECCVEKLRTLLAEPVAKEEPSLEEVQRRGYRYGPGEPIPGDAVDTARERETPWFAELVQPRVNGKPFRCACGSSVFRHRAQPFGGVIGYACNACGAHYEGSSGG